MKRPPKLADVDTPRTAVGLYLRISEDKRLGMEDEGAGVERQGDDGLDLIRRRDWTLAETYVDNDKSATSGKPRPGFEALLHDIRSQRIHIIVAWAFDRLVRTRGEGVELIETCIKYKVTIALVKGSDIDMTTAIGQAMADMMLAWARLEMAQKSERQTRASQQKIEKGQPHGGGRAPFGYASNRLDALVPNEVHSLRLAFAYIQAVGSRSADGSLAALAAKWEEEGIRSPWTGRPFTKVAIRTMLLHPRYIGIRTHYGAEVGPGNWEPIIDEATFRNVGAFLTEPSRKKHKGQRPKYLLAGIALCGRCADNGTVTTMKTGYRSQSGNARAYTCRKSQHLSRLAEPVEQMVQERVLDMLAHPRAASILLDRDMPDLDALRAKANGLRERRKSILGFVASGDFTKMEAREHLDALAEQLGEIEAQAYHADRGSVLAAAVLVADEAGPEVTARLAAVAKAWATYGLGQRRAMIQLLVKVTLNRGGGRRFRTETVVIEPA